MHEAQLYGTNNCFITLTYDDEHVPQDYSVKLRDLQLFFKRLRKSLGSRVRFFACGEYGDKTLRPHYHSLIFNYDFPDKKLHAERNGNRVYKSDLLQKLWPLGELNEIGDLTYQSAGYVARYSMKKVVGDRADDHYLRVSPIDGNAYRVASEFLTMSKKPGIASGWFEKYKSDLYPSDFVIVDGKKHPVPDYYTKKLQEEELTKVKRARKRQAVKQRHNSTPERLAVREIVTQEKLKKLQRSL